MVTYPTPVADSIEARQKLADIAGTAGQVDKQRYWQREIVNADRTAGAGRTDRTQYLAAKSQLALASPARDEFRDIALVLPLKTSLAKKKKAMEAALGAYKTATDYRVAEVTTLATYEIAEIYRKLGQDIMKSERPKKIAGDQLDEYNSLLEEQAFPFEEQAISTHEINTKRTRDGVYDEGVKKSFAALAELKAGRYGKTEMLNASFDAAGAAGTAGAGTAAANGHSCGSDGSSGCGRSRGDTAPVVRPTEAAGARHQRFHARARPHAQRDPTQAILEFQLMTQSYPDLPGPYANLGLLYRNANQLTEAESCVRRRPRNMRRWDAATWTEYGVTLRQAGKFAEARTAYEKAIAAEPVLRAGASQSRRVARPVPRRSTHRAIRARDLQDTDGRRQARERLARRAALAQQVGRACASKQDNVAPAPETPHPHRTAARPLPMRPSRKEADHEQATHRRHVAVSRGRRRPAAGRPRRTRSSPASTRRRPRRNRPRRRKVSAAPGRTRGEAADRETRGRDCA